MLSSANFQRARQLLTNIKLSPTIFCDMAKNLLTVSQAAKLLKVSPSAIHDAITRGRLNSTRVGTIVLISRSNLEKYALSRQHTKTKK